MKIMILIGIVLLGVVSVQAYETFDRGDSKVIMIEQAVPLAYEELLATYPNVTQVQVVGDVTYVVLTQDTQGLVYDELVNVIDLIEHRLKFQKIRNLMNFRLGTNVILPFACTQDMSTGSEIGIYIDRGALHFEVNDPLCP